MVMRTGDSIRYQQGFSGGITCFRGKISAEKLVGTQEEFGEIDTPITSKKTSIAFTATDDSLSLGQDLYAKGGDPLNVSIRVAHDGHWRSYAAKGNTPL